MSVEQEEEQLEKIDGDKRLECEIFLSDTKELDRREVCNCKRGLLNKLDNEDERLVKLENVDFNSLLDGDENVHTAERDGGGDSRPVWLYASISLL